MANTIKPHIKLPNGDVLFEGDYAKNAGGYIVGPLFFEGGGEFPWGAPWPELGPYYHRPDGTSCLDCSEDDLIAKADPPINIKDVADEAVDELKDVLERLGDKSETVVLWWGHWGYASKEGPDGATHSITFTLIEGKPPTGTFTNEDGETIVVEDME